jgi:hypothetical protein
MLQSAAFVRRAAAGTSLAGFLGLLALACTSRDQELVGNIPQSLGSAITGAAAASVDATGRFAVQQSRPRPSNEIDEDRARRVAGAYLQLQGPFLQGALEGDRGGPIDIAALRSCGRAFYAESPYEPIAPGPDVPDIAFRLYGSWWVVGFCGSAGNLEVSVAVSAVATVDEVDGKLTRPPAGNEFITAGVPSTWDSPVGLAPETAALKAHDQTHRLVASAPRLTLRSLQEAQPQGALWSFELDGNARMLNPRTGKRTDVRKVYMGLPDPMVRSDIARSKVRIPLADQPSQVTTRLPIPKARLSSPTEDPVLKVVDVTVTRRSDTPVRFEPVEP